MTFLLFCLAWFGLGTITLFTANYGLGWNFDNDDLPPAFLAVLMWPIVVLCMLGSFFQKLNRLFLNARSRDRY